MDGNILLPLGVLAVFFAVYVGTIIWGYQDAEERGKSGCLVALLIALLSWPLSILLWIVFRPDDTPRRSGKGENPLWE